MLLHQSSTVWSFIHPQQPHVLSFTFYFSYHQILPFLIIKNFFCKNSRRTLLTQVRFRVALLKSTVRWAFRLSVFWNSGIWSRVWCFQPQHLKVSALFDAYFRLSIERNKTTMSGLFDKSTIHSNVTSILGAVKNEAPNELSMQLIGRMHCTAPGIFCLLNTSGWG